MALHEIHSNNVAVEGSRQEPSTNVDEINCPLTGQESSGTQDITFEAQDSEEMNLVALQEKQDQEIVQEMPVQGMSKKRISDVFPSLDLDDEGNLVNRGLGPVIYNHEDIQGVAQANNSLVNAILDFVDREEKDEVVREYFMKFFEELNDKPFKKYVGNDGSGWYAIYLTLLRFKREPKMAHVFRGLILIANLQDESDLLMISFNPDMLREVDPSLDLLIGSLYNLGYVFQKKLSAVNPVSNLDKSLGEQVEILSQMTKEVVKEATATISSGGGYSNSFDGWDLLKWGAIAAGVIGGGYLAYKGYQALTEDDPNDVVFIDVDDYDTGHLDFI